MERIELLRSLKVDQHLAELPEAIVRRYAQRGTCRGGPYCRAHPHDRGGLLFTLLPDDQHRSLAVDVRRRVADLWRKAADEADAQRVDYACLYQQLLNEVSAL